VKALLVDMRDAPSQEKGEKRRAQQFWASEKVEEPRGIKVGSYCA